MANPKLKPDNELGVRADKGDVEHSEADRGGDEVDDVSAVLRRRRDFLGWRMLAAMIVLIVWDHLR